MRRHVNREDGNERYDAATGQYTTNQVKVKQITGAPLPAIHTTASVAMMDFGSGVGSGGPSDAALKGAKHLRNQERRDMNDFRQQDKAKHQAARSRLAHSVEKE